MVASCSGYCAASPLPLAYIAKPYMEVAGADGVPPVQQERGLPAAMEGLPDKMPFSSGYRYVIFHFFFVTITRRSLSLAIAASCLTFVALQVCSFACQTPTQHIFDQLLELPHLLPEVITLLSQEGKMASYSQLIKTCDL